MRLRAALVLAAWCTSVFAQQPPAPGAKPAASSSSQSMEFSDSPDFKIAGVTDWTAVGGHGSDVTLRTSENLARETLMLKPQTPDQSAGAHFDVQQEARLLTALAQAPASYSANHELGEYYLRANRYAQAVPLLSAAARLHADAEDEYGLALACRGLGDYRQAQRHVRQSLSERDTADTRRLAGDLDEKLGDPLDSVREDEAAVRLDPTEENYFAWGSELLLHRAVWQAAEVFKQGAQRHPRSARLLTAWGSALFAGARYDEAAQRLCEASDLNPVETEPYLFMGKVDLAAPGPLPCVEPKLARFVRQQPQNATAHYLYAMALMKDGERAQMERGEQLLSIAVTLDPRYAEAYLQIGIISAARHDYSGAVRSYLKAIEADPQLAEAHYRLAVAYDKSGDKTKAIEELRLHDELAKEQADVIEQQRREVKQFSVVAEQGTPKDSHP